MAIELAKSFLKLKEYRQLIHKEGINAYIEMDAYKELKRLKELKESHFKLVRSKKTLPKIKKFKISPKLAEIKEMGSKRENGS